MILIRTQSVPSDQNQIQIILSDERELIGVCFGNTRGIDMISGIAGSTGSNDITWILPLSIFHLFIPLGGLYFLDRIYSPDGKDGHKKIQYIGLTASDPLEISPVLHPLLIWISKSDSDWPSFVILFTFKQ